MLAYQATFTKELFKVLEEKNLTVHWEAMDYFSDGDYEACKRVCQAYIDGCSKLLGFFTENTSGGSLERLKDALAVSSFKYLYAEADSVEKLLDFQESIEISLFKIRSSIGEAGYSKESKLALLGLLNKVNKTPFEMFEGNDGVQKDFLSTQQVRVTLVRNVTDLIKDNEKDYFEKAVSGVKELLTKEESLDQLSEFCHEQASHCSQFIRQLPNSKILSEFKNFYEYYVVQFTELGREAKLISITQPLAIKAKAIADSYQGQLNSIAQDTDIVSQVKRYTDAYMDVMASKVEFQEQLAAVGTLESQRSDSIFDAYSKYSIDFVATIKRACVTIASYIKSQFNSDLDQKDLQQLRVYIRGLLMALQDNIALLGKCDKEIHVTLEDIYNKECHVAVEIYIEIKRIIAVKTQFQEQINEAMSLYDEANYVASDDCCSTILFAIEKYLNVISDKQGWFKEVLEKLQLDVAFFYDLVKENMAAILCKEDIPPLAEEEVSNDFCSDSWEQVDEPLRPKISDEEPVILGRKVTKKYRYPLGDLANHAWRSTSSEVNHSYDGVENSSDSLRNSGGGLNITSMYTVKTKCSRYSGLEVDESVEEASATVTSTSV